MQNLHLYLVNVIQPAIISEHFREYRSPVRTLGKENNNMVYLCTGFTMLPLHGNDGMEPKRRFLPNAKCGEKEFESGAKREGQSGFRKQDIFLLALKFK